MTLIPYDELVKVDVLPHCAYRGAKDESGKAIQVPYLNWAKCVELLHQNGAQVVYFTPLKNPDGGYLFGSKDVENPKTQRKTGCWFVSVEIHIDELVFTMDAPLLNGSLVVYEDTLNQLRIANCHARAFVKGVAIRTGLGFSLWCGESDSDSGADDLSGHNILAIRERVTRLITAKMKNGLTIETLAQKTCGDHENLKRLIACFQKLADFEKSLSAL